MIGPATGTRIFLACGHTDMRRGMDGLAALVQQAFGQDPFCGAVYLFRGKRGRLIKCVWHDGQGLCLFAKCLERGHFLWPMTNTGTVMLSAAQASMLLKVLIGEPRNAPGGPARFDAINTRVNARKTVDATRPDQRRFSHARSSRRHCG